MRVWLFKLLVAIRAVFITAVLLLAVRAGYEAGFNRAITASETQLKAIKKATPKTLGANEAPITANPHVYRPKTAVPPIVNTGTATIIHRVKTDEPVIFITIDDGVTPDQAGLALMRQRHAVATLFLNNANIHRHYDYYREWQKDGSIVQNHTDTHPHLMRIDVAQQQTEVCGHSEQLQTIFGKKPTLFRPPYGEIDATHLGLVGACGHKYVVQWSSYVEKGRIHYGSAGHMLPGEIVLLHFTPDLAADVAAVFAAADAQQLHIGQLEDWLK